MRRCKKCNLPETYPGIELNEENICQKCLQINNLSAYQGVDALHERINEILKNCNAERAYDCVVGFSGGRDSTYLLYFAKKVLKLNVLAITLEHDFMPELTKKNIKNIADYLDVKILFIKNEVLNNSSRKFVKAWAQKPDAGMCLTFCTGCRYGISKTISQTAHKMNIPIVFIGQTPYENIHYRVNVFCENDKFSTFSKTVGFTKRLLSNPSYLTSPDSLFYLLIDAVSYNSSKKGSYPVTIRPFYDYIEWNEDEIMSAIKNIGWTNESDKNNSWRSDCVVNTIRQYYYKKMLGYNDIDAYYAKLIRNGKIGIEDAVKRIETESKTDSSVIRSILKEYYNLDYDIIEKRIKKDS